jgi:hypothetical protein
MFKLPLCFRLKQGNQHLLLWVKRAQMMFDSIAKMTVSTGVQSKIMDWLSKWSPEDREPNYSVEDIVSWNTKLIDRDKENDEQTCANDSKSEGMSQLQEDTDATLSTK